MATMTCSVVSVSETIFQGEISFLSATGVEGELGIMPSHIPLVTLLKPGALKIVDTEGNEELVYVSGGVLEVQPHKVTVLADTAIRAENLDLAQIEAAEAQARNQLSDQSSDLDTAAAMTSLAESVAQLQTLRKLKNRA